MHSPSLSPLGGWGRNVILTTQLELPFDWDELSIDREILEFMDATYLQVHERDVYRHAANIARLWLLWRHGGVWMDHDFIPLVHCTGGGPAMAAHSDNGVCSCFMRFPAGHPILEEALFLIQRQHGKLTSEVASGEILLERLASNHELERLVLPFDPDGSAVAGATPWAVHLSSARRR
jgi:hypothetical protein